MQADALPAEEELKEVVGRHQRQHGEGEEREIGEEARTVRILLHVADGIEVHEAGDRGHHHQHHGGERVDAERPGGLQRAGIDEAEQLDARLMPLDADLVEGEPGEKRGDQHEARGDDFARARAEQASRRSRQRSRRSAGGRRSPDTSARASPSTDRFRRHRWCRGCGNRRRRWRGRWRLRRRRR